MFKFWMKDPLREENSGEGGASGAGAGQSQDFTAILETFKASLLGDIDKKVNGAIKGVKTDFEKQLKTFKPAEPPPSGDGEGNPDGQKPGKDGKDFTNTELNLLKKKLADMERSQREQNERIQQRERDAIQKDQDAEARAALSTITWRDGAAEDAFELFRKQVKRNEEDGTYYVGDGVPLKEAAKIFAESKPHFLPPKDVGSSGAHKNGSAGGQKRFHMRDYDANWSEAKKKEFGQAVLAGTVDYD